MKIRHLCAIGGIAAAVGAVVFMQSLVATNDAQAVRVAELPNPTREQLMTIEMKDVGIKLKDPAASKED